MRKLRAFNNVSLDGYFTDANGDMSWAHRSDPEWLDFVSGNASGNGALLLGRITYEMMASFWPTPMAAQTAPTVAKSMNQMPKYVVSKTLGDPAWQNTHVVRGDLVDEVRQLKLEADPDLVILGSGSVVAQLSEARLVDEYQVVVHPLVLGSGRSMFDGVKTRLALARSNSRTFENGCVVHWYRLAP